MKEQTQACWGFNISLLDDVLEALNQNVKRRKKKKMRDGGTTGPPLGPVA